MGSSTISLGLGLGGGKSATSSGSPGGGGGTPFANQYSVSFDGSNDYLAINSGLESTINNASALTISAWIKVSAHRGAIFSSGTSASDGIWLYPYDPTILLFTARSSSSPSSGISCAPPSSINEWHHIAGVLDGANSKIYIDGNLEGTGTLPALGSTGGSSPYIGSFQNSAGSFVNGLIDEVSIFDSVLSATDISTLRGGASAGTLGEPVDISSLNPVGWWRMGDNDGGTGTTITDQGSGGNNGTLTNGPTYSTDVPS